MKEGNNSISGDMPLGFSDKLKYFFQALGEIVRSLISRTSVIFFNVKSQLPPLIDEPFSPFRIMQEAFLREILTPLVPGQAEILEVGCGRGQNHMIFQQENIKGIYVGIDPGEKEKGAISDRIMEKWQSITDKSGDTELKCSIKQISLEEFAREGKEFNCIFSCSVLEHLDNIPPAINLMNSLLSGEGITAHTVPAPFSYFLYGPHGYRRFAGSRLNDLFCQADKDCRIYALGGAFSFFVHLVFITLPLVFLKKDLRRSLPGLYRKILYTSLRLDRYLPFLHTGYGVVVEQGSLDNRNIDNVNSVSKTV